MSSYGSHHSASTAYIHPSQYAPPQHQYPPQQHPPYPTTPGAPPPTSQPGQAFYAPPPPQQYASSPQPAMYSSSPHQQYFPPSPTAQLAMPSAPRDRRPSSSHSQSHPRPHFPPSSAPIPITQQQRPPIYARAAHNGSHDSHHSSHMHDPHAFADGEDADEGRGRSYSRGGGRGKEGDNWGEYGLDEETLRQYEKRYAKDRELEKRPTLGGSVLSAIGFLGSRKRE